MANVPAGGKAPEFDETTVVDSARQGDRVALSALYEHYFPRVYRYVAARLASTEDAEDVTTEVFLRVIDNLQSFSWRGLPFGAWVFRIAHNEVISFVRRQRNRAGSLPLTEDLLHTADEDDHVAAVERKFALAEVRRAAERLPEAQRQVIALRFGAGLSVAETASALGKTENTVKVLQHKGIARLQQWVRRE